MVKSIADAMVKEGFKDAGYEFVVIDDCWLASSRDASGKLAPNPTRFPNGIKAVADYVHSLGLKFGIYEDVGVRTCAGFPGSEFNMMLDAQTFAEWGVDLVKFDGCNFDAHQNADGYSAFGRYLNLTGRPIVYSCEWPLYDYVNGITSDFEKVASVCNYFRDYNDVGDSWDSISSIINYWADDKLAFSKVAGPGSWNDPDMLVLGDFGLSYEQERTQMAFWAIFAAPLFVSADIRNLRETSRALLLNRNVIAINQDPLGVQAVRILTQPLPVFRKQLAASDTYAFVVYFSYVDNGTPQRVQIPVYQLGLSSSKGYMFTEVFTGVQIGKFYPKNTFVCDVNPSGVFMFVASPVQVSDTVPFFL